MKKNSVTPYLRGTNSGFLQKSQCLDYFGTVNLVARLPALSSGGNGIFSEKVAADLGAQAWLRDQENRLSMFQAEIKGFEYSLRLWRLCL